ncbi:calcium-binding protein [Mesorhizobium sp. CGMCC 1.15528]|uniref:Calcium-binding protein n=1 Tax=Mesorhizobium zhangyense TaxID=1776730 RepID=A0A7C9R9H1_9HYPH|nr:calcium-binding protein [Mesorhizobium zhangyense]NGN43474.1 calcium-binding protein [Mesorhizobium zhangyense]
MADITGTDLNDYFSPIGVVPDLPPGFSHFAYGPGDHVFALAGDDIIIGAGTRAFYVPGEGYDTLDYQSYTQGIVFADDDLGGYSSIHHLDGTPIGYYWTVARSGFERFYGTAFDDTLRSGHDTERLYGYGGNDTLIAGANAETLDGGGDNDTVSYTNSTAGVTIDLSLFLQISGGYASGDTVYNIENVTGSAHTDSLTGSDGNNVLAGLGGADILVGGLGSDTAGYTASTAGVIVSLTAGSGTGGHAEGDTLTGVENLTGSAFGDTLTGTDADANVLNGGAGNDVLIGLGGADSLIGGLGTDTADYTASTVGVIISLETGSGTGGHAEGDTLTGIENVIGSAHADSLTGDGGNNVLTGLGGADILVGGLGSDTADYTASTAGVFVSLETGSGIGGHAEGDTLTGIENVIGSEHTDLLVGDGGNNLLVGLGGGDTLIGGLGNDIFVVDTAGDQTIELAGEGTDTVRSSISWALGENIERLELQGVSNINGVGNILNNTIVGNAGNNTIDGGPGNDTLTGGGGDDVYIVSSTGDRIIEASGEGRDTIRSSIDWTIGANIERLELQGTANLTGNGNTLANTIGGNSGNNILRGGAGNDTLAGYLGNDRLVGGEGKDSFVFNTVLGPNNVDTITDYNVADDTIQLNKGIFTGLTVGWLTPAAFHVGNAAHDATDRIIYNSTNGDLLFDRDGTGSAGAIKFASISAGLAVTANDFFVV